MVLAVTTTGPTMAIMEHTMAHMLMAEQLHIMATMAPPIILSSTILFSIIPSSTQFNPAQFNITLCTGMLSFCKRPKNFIS